MSENVPASYDPQLPTGNQPQRRSGVIRLSRAI